MKKRLSRFINKIKRYKYLLSKAAASPNKIIVIYTRQHPIYTSIFEHILFDKYKFVYIDFKKPLNAIEQKLFNKAKIVHADSSVFPLEQYKDKIVIAECEGVPTQQMLTDKRIKKIYLFSNAAAPHLVGKHPEMKVLYPAIKVPEQMHNKQPNDHEIVLTTVGYGSFRKGFDVLYKIYEKLKEKYPVKLVIAGALGHNYEYFPEITKEAYDKANFPDIERKLRADPDARMEQVSNHVLLNEILPETDIYLHLCRIESFGYSILEAMSFGIPVIATRQWAIPEIVEDNVSGILVNDFADDINSEAWFNKTYTEGLAAVTKLIEDAGLRKQMGVMGYNRIRDIFDLEKKKKTLENDYDELLRML